MSTSTCVGAAPRGLPDFASDVTSPSGDKIRACPQLMSQLRPLGEKRIEIAVLPPAFERALDEADIDARHRMVPQEFHGVIVRGHGARAPTVEETRGIKE